MIGCWQCEVITLHNMHTDERITALDKEFPPADMCLGGEDELLVIDYDTRSVVLLDISSTEFVIKGSITMTIKPAYIGYISDANLGGILLGHEHTRYDKPNDIPRVLQAFSIPRNEVLWEVDGTYPNKVGNTKGWILWKVLTSSEGIVYMVDLFSSHKCVFVLDGSTGAVLQNVKVPSVDIRYPLDADKLTAMFCDDQTSLIIQHQFFYMSYFKIKT